MKGKTTTLTFLSSWYSFDENTTSFCNFRICMLSGGERRRLQLLSVLTKVRQHFCKLIYPLTPSTKHLSLMKRPNFLILDEPSNDIDLDTLSALEGYLDEYNGVLVIVSHDRFFTDKVTNHLFVFDGNGVVKDFSGSLSDYAACLAEIDGSHSNAGDNNNEITSNKSKASYKDDKKIRMQKSNELKNAKRKTQQIEKDIEKLRKQIEDLEVKIEESSDEGWTYLAELAEKMNSIKEQMEDKEMEWLEFAEIIESSE
jgi:ATP-binding cassette subfamily F protein uup